MNREWGSIPGQVIPKTQKMLQPSLKLSIIRYGSRVKLNNPWKEVVPNGKGTFGSPLTMVTDFTFYLYTHKSE